MPRFHSQNIAQVYRRDPRITPTEHRLMPMMVTTPIGPQLYTVSATDGLYMFDSWFKTEMHRQGDNMYLLDSAFLQAIRQLYSTDTIYTVDSRVMLREHRETDKLYLLDVITKTVLFLIQNGLYLLDTATTTKISGLLSFLFTDYLLLGDVMMKTEMHRQTEGMYVTDSRVSTILKQLLDSLYVLDRRYSVMQVGPQDQLLLNELTTKFLHAIRNEGLYLSDSVAQQLFTAVTEMISWVRLRASDPTGASLSDADALSVRTAVRDFLGVLLQTTKPRLH